MHISRSSGVDGTHVQAVPGWRSVLPVRMQTRSGIMVVVCPPVIALLPTPPVAAPAGRTFTSTTLTFHHSQSVSILWSSCHRGGVNQRSNAFILFPLNVLLPNLSHLLSTVEGLSFSAAPYYKEPDERHGLSLSWTT